MLKKISNIAYYSNFHKFLVQKTNSHDYYLRTVRNYCQLTRVCWNCQSSLKENAEIFCNSCHFIQKVPKIDYFDLFGIQKEPRINMKELTKRFRNVQSQIHPDKFSTKTQEEQIYSSEWSSLANEAYKTLQSPLKRAEYLLSLRGIDLSEDSKADDKEFLMEMMEKNEAVEDASTKDDLLNILTELQDVISDLNTKFADAYQSKNYAAAKNYLIKMRFYISIENITKEKILQF